MAARTSARYVKPKPQHGYTTKNRIGDVACQGYGLPNLPASQPARGPFPRMSTAPPQVFECASAETHTAECWYVRLSGILVLFLVREVGISPGGVGLLISGMSVGSVIGAASAAALARRFGTARALLLSELVAAPFALRLPLTSHGPGGCTWWLAASSAATSSKAASGRPTPPDTCSAASSSPCTPELRHHPAGRPARRRPRRQHQTVTPPCGSWRSAAFSPGSPSCPVPFVTTATRPSPQGLAEPSTNGHGSVIGHRCEVRG